VRLLADLSFALIWPLTWAFVARATPPSTRSFVRFRADGGGVNRGFWRRKRQNGTGHGNHGQTQAGTDALVRAGKRGRHMSDSETIWDRLASCVVQLDEPFRASEIIGWFRRHYPGVNEASLRAHIQSATSNVKPSSKVSGLAHRRPLITRISHGVYVRYVDSEKPRDDMDTSGLEEPSDVILLACSATKATTARPARELYLGEAFLKGRQYAEESRKTWYILSGKWGLLDPDDVIAPYDLYLGDQSIAYRTAWGEWVTAQLLELAGSLEGATVEVLASQSYVEPIRGPLQSLGVTLAEPFRGLRMGEQLGWFASATATVDRREDTATSDASLSAEQKAAPTITVVTGPADGGPFKYRWPDGIERFDLSWQLSVERGGKVYSVRHCLGRRRVYGADRRHSVTFVNGAPEVEGVAPDDYESSRALVSSLKGPDRKLVRRRPDVPKAFDQFLFVDHLAEIKAPYSRDALAVKLPEDDVVGWASYALARIEVRQSALVVAARNPVEADSAPELVANEFSPDSAGVVRALLELGRSGLDAEWVGSTSFTPNVAANQLLVEDPFAFLLGVLFDHGIPAERAWQAPFELKSRLGHLSPSRIAAEESAVWEAINTQPKLHRFVELLPGWVVAAARIVMDEYGGDAGAIWAGSPTAREVQRRLDEFPGIGQKKAAMAVEILERDLGVPIEEMHGSDVAYDVHVRRVFLRTHLAQYDDLDHMVQVARSANPERPGEIDLPAWLVGRTWCRAGLPLCDSCPLGKVCPKDVQAASRVRGV
jgi:uncharacterized HhH-GPD family protein